MAGGGGNEKTTSAVTTTTTTTTQQKPQPSTTQLPENPISKNAQKRLKKQERYEAKKAEKKASEKEHKRAEKERKHKEWEEKLASLGSEEEKLKLIESRKELRKERMDERCRERQNMFDKLERGKLHGQSVVIDLEFAHLMTQSELHSLVQQIMYCYAVNRRSNSPCHLWLTGCEGTMESQFKRIPGFDKWVIEKECRPYIEALEDQKESLVYLTADAETVLEDLDPKKLYIIGGLVDRNRWKGITMKKAQEQGIQTARLPIGNYLKMSSSQVLTVNQVVEILLKYLEMRDWKTSFFQVIPQRKQSETNSSKNGRELEDEDNKETDNTSDSQKKLKMTDLGANEEELESAEEKTHTLFTQKDLN